MASSFKQRTTPGVYVTEFAAFPPSVVGVQTWVPAFIGYTEQAVVNGKPAYQTPIPISSMAAFEEIFGKAFKQQYAIESATPPSGDFQVGDDYYKLTPATAPFYLYYSMRLFFANGGGHCYVVSVGDYSKGVVSQQDLQNGLATIGNQVGPTMLVVPDAALLPDGGAYQAVAQQMLAQAGTLADRFVILDVYGAQTVASAKTMDPVIEAFQTYVGENSLSYGAAYFPFLNTSVVTTGDIDYTYFAPATLLQSMMGQVAAESYPPGSSQLAAVQSDIDQITTTVADPATLNQRLSNALPAYKQWQSVVQSRIAVLPPSGGMAGVYCYSDQTRGVWNAPANLTMNSVDSVTVEMNNDQQGRLNEPLNGKAIDVIRDFVGRGSVVWGGRTLDGNSNDWRYIQVRRTIVYIEQSIKNALNPFVFAANDGQTWVTVTSMISNFLQGVWSQGGLMGDKASDAFTVACGLGSTMTAQDILNGYMIVQVTLQMIRPAEFIELTFKQKMQGS
jgi:uncharacterized protein